MTSEFLNEDNLCGQHLLKLASRGSAIISELLRLSEHIPSIFLETRPGGSEQKSQAPPSFYDLIMDFRYFKIQDQFEKFVQSSQQRLELDDKFRESNLPILERFYGLFDAIYSYSQDLNRFVSDMKDGVYISQTFESILINADGKQLLSESFYLYGVMLLLLEIKIEGKVRERMLISFLRYKGRGEVSDKVCQMCSATGASRDMKKPPVGYPEEYFSRIAIPQEVINMIIGRIRSDDIYNMVYNYPTPEHRSTALSQQAAMLYVLLFFLPETLHAHSQIMREIVYKHFNDNWVVVWYLGYTTDVTFAWQNFKAANAAIHEAITMETVTYVTKRMRDSLREINPEVEAILRDGVLTEVYALEQIQSTLLPKIRNANVTLRWCILHTTRGPAGRRITETMKTRYDVVTTGYNQEDVLTLLLNVAQLEFLLKTMFAALIKTKRSRWNAAKEKGVKKMSTLATYFSGEHALSDGVKETQLQGWFEDISTRIEELDYSDATSAGRKIQKLMDALTDVQEFHQINGNMQVMQFLGETRDLLKQMIRYVNIERKVLVTIMTVGDLSYAWELMNEYNCFVAEMQNKIRKKPHLVLQMRSTFLKLSTLMEVPLTRICQAAQGDEMLSLAMESVSDYFSTQLVAFVRKVLHVIPVTIFEKLKDIMRIQVSQLKECPTKVPKDQLKDIAQLDIRTRYAMLTCEIAKFADGILAMEQTLVGVISVDPQRLLEEGVRRELVEKVSIELNKALRFDDKKLITIEDINAHLGALANLLGGMKTSLEYIQDYIGIYGLKMWQEEYSRIISFNVEMECNQFMLQYISHWQSAFQSDVIPIPYFEPHNDTYGFLGRLVKVLLVMTDPRRCIYLQHLGAWYDPQKVWKEVVGPRLFTRIHISIATQGLNGLDRLSCFLIAKELKALLTRIRAAAQALTTGANNRLLSLQNLLAPFSGLPKDASRYYAEWTTVKFEFVEALGVIGRAQLLRKHIANELRFSVKLHSGALHKAVSAVNQAILNDVKAHYEHPTENPYPANAIAALTPYMDACGMGHAISKIYITSEPLAELSIIMFLQFLRVVPRFVYDERMDCLMARKKEDGIDACGVAVGIITTLQQFHRSTRENFIDLVAQYVRVQLSDYDVVEKKIKEKDVIPPDALTALHFLDLFSVLMGVPIEEVARLVPTHVLIRFKGIPMRR